MADIPPDRGIGDDRRQSRTARHAKQHRQRRKLRRRVWRAVIWRIALVFSSLVVAALGPGSGYLRSYGVPLPHVHLPVALTSPVAFAVIVYLIILAVGELYLLRLAVAAVGDPDAHDRYLHLMLQWPYALLAPYILFKTVPLPTNFFGQRNHHDSEPQ